MFSIWKILDQYLQRDDSIPDIRPVNLYPSEASVSYQNSHGEVVVKGTCIRRAWLRIKVAEQMAKTRQKQVDIPIRDKMISVVPTRIDLGSLWRFKAGDYFELLVKDQMRDAGILHTGHKKFFTPLRYGYFLSGELDMIAKNPLSGGLLGTEVKSISGYDAQRQIIGDPYRRWKGKPKHSHVMQAAIYDDQWPELEEFKLLYICRDNQLKVEFDIKVDTSDPSKPIFIDGERIKEYTLSDVYNRYYVLCQQLTAGTIPARDYDLIYSDDQMNRMSARKELSKTNAETWKKYWDREQEYKSGKKNIRRLKRPVVSPWNCLPHYCPFSNFCYREDGSSRDDELM